MKSFFEFYKVIIRLGCDQTYQKAFRTLDLIMPRSELSPHNTQRMIPYNLTHKFILKNKGKEFSGI